MMEDDDSIAEAEQLVEVDRDVDNRRSLVAVSENRLLNSLRRAEVETTRIGRDERFGEEDQRCALARSVRGEVGDFFQSAGRVEGDGGGSIAIAPAEAPR